MKLKQWQNIFLVTVNANPIVQHVIQNKKGISQCECKNYNYEKYYSWNPSTCICENCKHLKSVVNTSVTECDKIVIVMNNLSTKKTNTITTNVTSTVSINCHSKKVRDCYILHTVLLAIILLLIFTIICYHYAEKKGIT